MITKHDREQFIILSLNVRCYGNIPLNQANIIGATCFSYVKKEEELGTIKIVSTRQLTRLNSFIAWNV